MPYSLVDSGSTAGGLVSEGLALQIFDVNLGNLSLGLADNITIDVSDNQIQLSTKASPGQPFNGFEVDMTATLGPQVQMIRFTLNTGLDDLIRRVFDTTQSSALAKAINAVLLPIAQLFTTPTVILSLWDGSDGDYTIAAGVNFYMQVPLRDLPPFSLLGEQARSLALFLPASGSAPASEPQLLVHVSAASTFGIDAQLILNQKLCSAVTLDLVGLSVKSENLTTNTIDANAKFSIKASSDLLVLTGGIGVEQGADGVELHGFAALDPQKPWKNPLGATGVTVGELGFQLGVTSTPPYVAIGFRGTAWVGDHLLGGTFALNLDPASPGATILELTSTEGASLPKLLSNLIDQRLVNFPLFEVSLKNVDLYVAPQGGSIAGKEYGAGYRIQGDLDLWNWKAAIKGKLDYATGAYLVGDLDPLILKGQNFTYLAITDTTGHRGANLTVVASSNQQAAKISGQVKALQRRLTCLEQPWLPVPDAEMARLINVPAPANRAERPPGRELGVFPALPGSPHLPGRRPACANG